VQQLGIWLGEDKPPAPAAPALLARTTSGGGAATPSRSSALRSAKSQSSPFPAAHTRGKPRDGAATAMRRRLAQDATARGDAASTHALPFLGAGAVFNGAAAAGFKGLVGQADLSDGAAPRVPTLAPLHDMLQVGGRSAHARAMLLLTFVSDGLTSFRVLVIPAFSKMPLQGIMREGEGAQSASVPFHPALRAAASDAVDAGLAALYPTAESRRTLLESLLAKGGTVDIQVSCAFAPRRMLGCV
jgi:hypothetical protein